MSSYTSYSIDQGTRFLIEDNNGVERVITDLGGRHDLTRIYIRLASDLWGTDSLGKGDLLEIEMERGFQSLYTFIDQEKERRGENV